MRMKKRAFAVLLAVVMIAFASVVIAGAASLPDEDSYVTIEDGCYLLGDINLDGKVAASDSRRALRYAVGLENLTADEFRRADLNGDSRVLAADARMILRLAVKLDPLPQHQPVVDAAVAPTCTEIGYTEGRHCIVCNTILKEQEIVPALGHTYEIEEGVAPTCTEAGLTQGMKCSVCGTVFAEQTAIPATGHNYIGTVTTQPTCTEKGVKTFVCANDASHTYTEEINALVHDLVKTAAVAPTHFNPGNTTYYACARCGNIFSDPEGKNEITKADTAVPAAEGHVIVSCEGKEPTCTEAGWKAYEACTTCEEYSTYEAIPALGHSYEAVVTAPTCVKDGFTTYTCSRCGDSYMKELTAALGHSYTSVTVAPTCIAEGYTEYTCSVCSHTYRDNYVPAHGHNYECTQTVAPTCTEKGYRVYVCTYDASHTFTDEIDMIDHDYVDKEVPATWTKNGKTYKECTLCGDVIEEAPTDTKLHTVMTAANDWAEDKGLDAIITGSETNGADNTAVIELNVDGIWSDLRFEDGAFDGFMNAFGKAVTEYFGTDAVTIDGNAVYTDGKFRNTAVKNALFDIGAGFFYKIANIGADGVYGEYDVTIDGEAVDLTVRFTGSEENLNKVKSFAGTIADHISATVVDGNLVIDVIAPDQLIATIANEYQGSLPVAEALKRVDIGGGLNILSMKDAGSVFGSQVSAVNKLCAFLCKLNPLVNKVLLKIDEATVTLADGFEENLIDTTFDPEEETYTAFLDAVIAALDNALLERTVGEFTEKDGVYTVPVNVAVNMTNLGIMAGDTIRETVIINLHLFDNCKHPEIVEQPAVAATCTETGLTAGSYCRICGKVFAAQETISMIAHSYADKEDAATWTKNGRTYKECTVCGNVIEETATDTKLHSSMGTANAFAEERGLNAFISGADTNGEDNTAVITLNVDGIWSDPEFKDGAFDGFMSKLGETIKETFNEDVITIDGQKVYVDGNLQNTAVKNALFDIGDGFFYKIANLGADGIYGEYDVTIGGEAIDLTVKFTGSEANLNKVKSFAGTIADHISATVVDGNLVIDVIAPDKLVSYIKSKCGNEDPVTVLNQFEVGTGLSILASRTPDQVFGSQVSAVNKLCAFLCKLSPLANKVLGKIKEATVTLANGNTVALFADNAEFAPEAASYYDFMTAAIDMLSEDLLCTTVGSFENSNGVYTVPVNVSVDMSNLGIMAGETITETVIINLHIFD